MLRVVKVIVGVLCFGLGAAFAMAAVNELVHANHSDSEVSVIFFSMLGSMFLLGSYLLLRRRLPSP